MNFCRDWMPMIDSPSQKITYNATIVAPTEFVVSMSGNETSKFEFNDTHTATMFECALKIPSYQVALIVGDVVSQALSDRIIVFAEPGVIDAAIAEFEDLPLILNITEAYLGPYIWGVYSMFVMPPSFPFGGMEHVKYVFAPLLLVFLSEFS
jgi:leukotriene-A4 hydrolase